MLIRIAAARRDQLLSGQISGMIEARDPIDRSHELLPSRALLGEHLCAHRRQAVVASSPLPCLFDPAALDPAALFESIQQWIQRGDAKTEESFGARLDQFAQFIPMARLR